MTYVILSRPSTGKEKKIIINIHFNKILYFLIKSKNGQNSPKNVKKGIFVTKITNTFDFSSPKSKKSQAFHMESPQYKVGKFGYGRTK